MRIMEREHVAWEGGEGVTRLCVYGVGFGVIRVDSVFLAGEFAIWIAYLVSSSWFSLVEVLEI